MLIKKTIAQLLIPLCVASQACGSDIGSANENELITTVVLTFAPAAGPERVFEFDDPDGDGGDAPSIDDVLLAPGSYQLSIKFENRLETPAEDITEEIDGESDEHQIFLTGTAVSGPATDASSAALTHRYADNDRLGLPVGLNNEIAAAAGTGELTITLRHLPPIGDAPTKASGLAAQVAAGGFTAIGGATDAQVNFPVTVQ